MYNKYEITVFDGFSCRTLLVTSYDMVSAIQNSGFSQQVISAKLVGSVEIEDLTQQ